MKLNLKKLITLVTVMAVMISTLMCMAVSASAKGVFDDAVRMEELEYYSFTNLVEGRYRFYKITLNKESNLIFRWNYADGIRAELYSSNASLIEPQFFMGYNCSGDKRIENLKTGTYYLKIYEGNQSDSRVDDFYYTFEPIEKPTLKLSMTLKKGETIQLDGITENYDGKIEWLSTKKTVAAVTSTGKVTAKKKGTATIRAFLDDGTYAEIRIKVK